MASRNVVIDTHIFDRSLVPGAPYREIMETLVRICDRVVVNKSIIGEYLTQAEKAGASTDLVLRVLQAELPQLGKLRRTANRSSKRLLPGIPKQDQPFIEAARMAKVGHLITNDHRLHERRATLRREGIEVLSPTEYLKTN